MEEVTILVPRGMSERVRALADRYRTSYGGMVSLVLQYYFGDGLDHLRCEHCGLWKGYCVGDLESGTQLEIEDHATLLD